MNLIFHMAFGTMRGLFLSQALVPPMKDLDAFKHHGDIIWNIANILRGPYRPPSTGG